jgi:flagella synthesis protein FlgN
MAKHLTPQLAQHFLKMINEDTIHVQKLHEVLLAENESLKKRPDESFKELLRQKNLLLVGLEQRDMQRKEFLKRFDIPQNAAGIQGLISKTPVRWQDKFYTIWNPLQTLIKECHDLNTVNGRMLHHTRESTNKILSILQGRDRFGHLYEESGRSTPQIEYNSLAKA